MAGTCRAVVFDGQGGYAEQAFAMPEPGPGEAVLQVEAVGMCSSDVAQLHGHKHVPGEVAPIVPGHEIVGRIHSLGEGADFGVNVGDRVGVDLVLRCEPEPSNPLGLVGVYGYSFGPDDGHGLWGGYAEYMGIRPGTQLVKLTDDVPASHLSLFEPLASCVHWLDLAGVGPNDSVLIHGPGHMGLICAAVAKYLGAKTIIVTGTGEDADRLAVAREVGADHTIDVSQEDVVQRAQELAGGMGPSVVVDLAAVATITVPQSLEMAQPGGRIVLAGLKNYAMVEIMSDLVVLKSLTIHGGSGSTPASMRRAGEMLNAQVLPLEALLGEVFTLDELDEAMSLLERTADRDAVRVSLVHNHD